nr:response regulator transcription factor [Desulfobulbaceae bacterium]
MKTQKTKSNIVIADDHTFVRQGLRELLENQADMHVIGEAKNGKEAVELCKQNQVDVVLMDISMNGLNGIDATKLIKADKSETKIVMLSMHAEKNIVKDALKAGANGYLLKNSAFEEIHRAIRVVVAGETYISPQIATLMVSEFLGSKSSKQETIHELTDRERQVLQYIAEGKRTKEISEEIRIGVRTIEKIRSTIMEKLGLYTIAELTKFAISNGITTIDY